MSLNKIIFYLLLFMMVVSFSVFLIKNSAGYLQKFDFERLDNLYNHSQFAQESQNRTDIIQDEDLYAYSGWYYLKFGKLDIINIEHPPLGKYLIGLSILLFRNQNIGQIFWGIALLSLLFLISKKIIKNNIFSLLTIFLLSLEALFKDQLNHSLLDLPLAVFLCFFFLITISSNKDKPLTFFFQGLSLGIVAAIKYSTVALVAFLTLIIYYLWQKEKKLTQKLLFIGLVASLIFLSSYFPFFIKNPSVSAFYSLQLKTLKIHLSHVPEYPKFQVFNVLFFNKWLSWWGDKNFIPSGYWNIFWPILTLNFFLTIVINFKKNLLINLWTLFYLLFLSFRLFFPRYLFLLLPFLYLQLCYNLKSLYLFLNRKS